MKRYLVVGIMILLCTMLGPYQLQAQEFEESDPIPSDIDEAATFKRLYGITGTEAINAFTGYHWVIGPAFHARDSGAQLVNNGNCVYRTSAPTSGFTDADQFTAHVDLPDGARILGTRYFFKDSSATNSTITLKKHNGAGTTTTITTINSTGSDGYNSVFLTTLNPHTVNNATGGLVLNWKTTDLSSNMMLCGVRLYVEYPASTPIGITANHRAETNATIENHSAFYVGSSFHRRESPLTYTTTPDGCLQASSNGAFTMDVNLPAGASINGLTLFTTADVVETSTSASLYRFSGSGTGVLLKIVERDSGASSGFDATSAIINPVYPIDEVNESYILTIHHPGDGVNHGVCGIRVDYTLNIPPFGPTPIPVGTVQRWSAQKPQGSITKLYHRWVGGSAFNGYDWTTSFGAMNGSCTRILAGTPKLTAPLNLPTGAALYDVVLYFYDSNAATNTAMELLESDGATYSNAVVTETSIGSAGYGIRAIQPSSQYFVDGASYPLNLVWTTPTSDTTQQLCGMRVSYTMQFSTPMFVPFVAK